MALEHERPLEGCILLIVQSAAISSLSEQRMKANVMVSCDEWFAGFVLCVFLCFAW